MRMQASRCLRIGILSSPSTTKTKALSIALRYTTARTSSVKEAAILSGRRFQTHRSKAIYLSLALLPITVAYADSSTPDDDSSPKLVHDTVEPEGDDDDDEHLHPSIWKRIWRWLDAHLIEPLLTARRFLHLALIFIPVIITSPILLLEAGGASDGRGGRRKRASDSERATTVWWYGFLVGQMERAGPTFIKVPA